jgi:hypothetical protein
MIGGALADLISPVRRQIVRAWRIAFGEEPGRSRPQAAPAADIGDELDLDQRMLGLFSDRRHAMANP